MFKTDAIVCTEDCANYSARYNFDNHDGGFVKRVALFVVPRPVNVIHRHCETNEINTYGNKAVA